MSCVSEISGVRCVARARRARRDGGRRQTTPAGRDRRKQEPHRDVGKNNKPKVRHTDLLPRQHVL